MPHKLEKNVPLPDRAHNALGKTWGLPAVMKAMQVGDSVVTDRGSSAAYSAARKLGLTVTCRAEGNKTRIWRTA